MTPSVGLTFPNGALVNGTLLDGTDGGGLCTELGGALAAPKSIGLPVIGDVSVSSAAGANAGGGLTADLRAGPVPAAGGLTAGGGPLAGELDGAP
ncbi:MAG: hypothetical protein AB7G28_04380 [Pirellulales bacterium]